MTLVWTIGTPAGVLDLWVGSAALDVVIAGDVEVLADDLGVLVVFDNEVVGCVCWLALTGFLDGLGFGSAALAFLLRRLRGPLPVAGRRTGIWSANWAFPSDVKPPKIGAIL